MHIFLIIFLFYPSCLVISIDGSWLTEDRWIEKIVVEPTKMIIFILVRCVSPACAVWSATIATRYHHWWGRSWSEQVWTVLQRWPLDVTRKGRGPCPVRSHVQMSNASWVMVTLDPPSWQEWQIDMTVNITLLQLRVKDRRNISSLEKLAANLFALVSHVLQILDLWIPTAEQKAVAYYWSISFQLERTLLKIWWGNWEKAPYHLVWISCSNILLSWQFFFI